MPSPRAKLSNEFPFKKEFEPYLVESFILSSLFIQEKILFGKKEQIILFLKEQNKPISLTEITTFLNEVNPISKVSVEKHMNFLIDYNMVESEIITDNKGRNKFYELTKVGEFSIKVCNKLGAIESLMTMSEVAQEVFLKKFK